MNKKYEQAFSQAKWNFEQWCKGFDLLDMQFIQDLEIDDGVPCAKYEITIDDYFDGAVEEMLEYIENIYDDLGDIGFAWALPPKYERRISSGVAVFTLYVH